MKMITDSRPLRHCLVALIAAATISSCSFLPRPATTHLAWDLEGNLIVIHGVAGGTPGRFIVGTAQPATVLDDTFPADPGRRGNLPVVLGSRYSGTAKPVRADLGGLADGILGADVWSRRSVTIDYRRGILILGRDLETFKEGLRQGFDQVPMVPVLVNGNERMAVVDSANPDTVQLPQGEFGAAGRRTIDLQVGEVRFDDLDAGVGPVSEIRIGNRVLSRFLVTVDYPRKEVTLWPY